MAKSLSGDLRTRLIKAVEGGLSCRAAADRFGVSPASAVRWVRAWRDTGVKTAKKQGGDRRSGRIEAYPRSPRRCSGCSSATGRSSFNSARAGSPQKRLEPKQRSSRREQVKREKTLSGHRKSFIRPSLARACAGGQDSGASTWAHISRFLNERTRLGQHLACARELADRKLAVGDESCARHAGRGQ
jgi:hypothetical protein